MNRAAISMMNAAFLLISFSVPISVSADQAYGIQRLAPADEYFGHFHLSILGIGNTIHDISDHARADHRHAEALLENIALTEDALRDWGTKYPQDPLFEKSLLSIEQLYLSIDGKPAMKHANDTLAWMKTTLGDRSCTRIAQDLVSNSHGAISDDGSPITADSPPALGMIPGLIPTDSTKESFVGH